MKDIFFRDTRTNTDVTWEKLISAINTSEIYNPYCISDDYPEIFKQIVFSMLHEKEVILPDSGFTAKELYDTTGFTDFSIFTENLNPVYPKIKDKADLIGRLRNTSENWRITLFTSGTTGTPRRVTHSFVTITRHLKYTVQNAGIVWGYAYNPAHMAGVQVFLQALLNGNPLIRLFELHREEIYDEISGNNITHISATPTFYRLLLPCDRTFPSVIRLTLGGEKMSENLAGQLKKVFPAARITNVYASTEAGTLFASDNDVFTINPANKHLIKIENDELLVHNSLLGDYQNDQGEWYSTGDLVELVSETPLRFRIMSRACEMINVGGYKVNPTEVEDILLKIKGIKEARVYPRASSVVGSLVCCDIVIDNDTLTEAGVRTILRAELQEYKIPRIINFVDQISSTSSGKIKRKPS